MSLAHVSEGWNDAPVSRENDNLKKNNVYPISRAVQNIMDHALKQHKEEDHKGREKHGHKQ